MRPRSQVKIDDVVYDEAIPTTLVRRKNEAASFTFDLPTDFKRRRGAWARPGSIVKLEIGDGKLSGAGSEAFVGFVTPDGLRYDIRPSGQMLGVYSIDMMGALAYELVKVTNRTNSTFTTSVVGDEIGASVRHLVTESTTLQRNEATKIDLSGVQSLTPHQVITSADEVVSDFGPKLKLIQTIRSLYTDTTTYPNPPLGATMYMAQKKWVFKKEEALGSPSSIQKTVALSTDEFGVFLEGEVITRPQSNRFHVVSQTDSRIFATHTNASRARQRALYFDTIIKMNTTDRGTLHDKALQFAKLNDKQLYEFTIKGFGLNDLYPSQVIRIEDSERYGVPEGNYEVQENEINLQSLQATVKLGNLRPIGVIL